MDYAIIRVGNKQHRVRDGETLVVDRVRTEEGASFEPVVLLGEPKVSATVVAHERGPKVVIGKYRKRTGYRRHTGFRAATSRITISLGTGGAKAAAGKARARRAGKGAPPETAAPAGAGTPTEAAAEPAAEAGATPAGYAEMTVAQIGAAAKGWSRDELAAALAYEREHAARKGAVAALESALAKEED